MKKLFLFSLVAIFAFSCDFNDQPEPRDEGQTWSLVGFQEKVDGDLVYTAVQDSAYVYTLMPDGNFTKKIKNYTLEGTYEKKVVDNLTHYLFQYNTKNSVLIHSCDRDMEDYFINSDGHLAGTWDSCEGTKLFFRQR